MHRPTVNCTSMFAHKCEENPASKSTVYKLNSAEMISTACHYSEDIFQSSAHERLAAMITKLPVDSDLDSSSSDSEDEDDTESILDGYARIIWTNLEESIDKINDILVVDRGFLHGDVVASVSEPLGQTGIVVDVDLTVDLKANSGEIIRNINSRKLQRIKAFVRGDYVIHGPWLGRVDEVVDNVTVLFDDGSKCTILMAHPECLVPISKNLIENAHYPYHPGQHVRADSPAVFKNGRWICGAWKPKHMEGIVSNVNVGSVYVYWIAAASFGFGSQPTTIPARQLNPKQLKLLQHFSFTKWQLGDWCFLPKTETTSEIAVTATQDLLSNVRTQIIVENSTLHSLDYGTSVSRPEGTIPGSCVKHQRCAVKQDKRGHKTEDIIERALFVVNVKTKVDVIWQDGTRSFGIDSRNLFPVDNMRDHDFWPEQYVLQKTLDDDSEARRVGIVESEDSKERTACVRWLKPVNNPEDSREFNKEVVSVYELAEHPDYNYFIGDIVIWLSPISKAPEVFWTSGHHSHKKEYEDKSKPENDSVAILKQKAKIGERFKESYLSWFGYITGLQQGNIEVAWADGTISKVGPQEIFVIDRDDYDGSDRSIFEEPTQGDEDDATSWETIDSERLDVVKEDKRTLKKVEEPAVNHSAVENDVGLATTENTVYLEKNLDQDISAGLSFPTAVIAFIAQFAYGLLGFRGSKGLTETSITETSNSKFLGGASQDQGLEEIIDETQMIKIQRQELSRDSWGHEYMTRIGEEAELKDESECKYGIGNEEMYSLQNIGQVATLDILGEFKSSIDTKQRPEDIVAPNLSGVTDDTPQYFKQFDSVKDPLDHYFLNEKNQPSSQRKWTKKVQQEWSILKECLPDRIYVRVYEDRMDILRAVIIGAAGTPYQDSLFFFDLQLPPDYPDSPPLIYYYSGGLRLNPNLYESGKVCLSLLNTWTGRGNEVWGTTNSSILQVLVSIQGLVLNAKPYFNEAGYDNQIGTAEGEKNSLSYNENTFLLSCRSMLYLLRRPPKVEYCAGLDVWKCSLRAEEAFVYIVFGIFFLFLFLAFFLIVQKLSETMHRYNYRSSMQHFELLIKKHFQNRGHYILLACDAYMKGAQVGSLSQDVIWPLNTSADSQDNTTVGFKLMLAKIIPKLVSAFSDVGTEYQQFSQLVAK